VLNGGGGLLDQAVTFPIPVPQDIPSSNVLYTPARTPVPHCNGPGSADPGFLCIYSAASHAVDPPQVKNFEDPKFAPGTGRLGFDMQWSVKEPNAFDIGSYTVTAP